MLTTCPECRTRFRVGQDQLDSKRGMVRCGRCGAVFNAYDALLPELEAPPGGGEPAAPGAAEATASQEARAGRGARVPDALSVAHGAGSDRPAEPAPEPEAASPAAGLEPPAAAGAPEPAAEAVPGLPAEAVAEVLRIEEPARVGPALESSDAILLAELPLRLRPDRGPAWRSLGWGLIATGLALLLCLQLVYFLRGDVVAWLPSSRPAVAAGCRILGCQLPLPEDPNAIRIEMSSLEADPEDASRTTLRLSLGNRSDETVAWPHLMLVLTDMRDVPIAQRPFAPADYLPKGVDPGSGLAPGKEQEIRLGLELKGLSAYGYRVEKRYP
jgi:predicted Zn finger-like uncharacterized protein